MITLQPPSNQLVEEARAHASKCEPRDFERAVSLLRKALDAQPNSAEACAGLAEALAHWGFRRELTGEPYQGHYDLALAYARRAVEHGPTRACSRRSMAVALRRGAQADAARRLEEATCAVELDPNDAESWYELWRARGYELGDDAIKRALGLRPTFFAALHDLGVALSEHGRHAEALRFLDRAVAVNPESVLALYNRAMTRHRMGDDAGAAEELRAIGAEGSDLNLVNDGLAYVEGDNGPQAA